MDRDPYASRRTPRDRLYPTCERAVAEFLVYPATDTSEHVTDILGLEPTYAHTKGEKSSLSRGRTIAPFTLWLLSSEFQVDSLDLRDHLDWLLNKLSQRNEQLSCLQRQEGLSMCISCIWWSRYGHGGPAIWPEQFKLMADMNLELSIEFSYYGEEE